MKEPCMCLVLTVVDRDKSLEPIHQTVEGSFIPVYPHQSMWVVSEGTAPEHISCSGIDIDIK
jgi:hypothetical protein